MNAALSWRPKGHIVVEIHDVEHELWAKQVSSDLIKTTLAKDVITLLTV